MTVQHKPQIVITQKRAFLVAGLRYAGKNEHGEVPALWDKEFLPRIHELDNFRTGATYGISRVMPDIPWQEGFEYLAGVEVGSLENLPPGMVGWEIPAQTYAILPANDVSGLAPALVYYYSEWLPRSKEYRSADGPMLELYPETFGQDRIIYLYNPVRAKDSLALS